MLKLNSCLLCLAGTVSRGSLTNPLQLGSCMQPAMASYCPHQLWLPNKERLRIGGADDSLGWSLSVNLSVMGYYLNSHRYHCALPQLVELFSSFAPKTFSLCCPAGFLFLFLCIYQKSLIQVFSCCFFFFSQTEITFTPNVPLPGGYVIIVHYHQPEHISFPVEVRVDAGREWKGEC